MGWFDDNGIQTTQPSGPPAVNTGINPNGSYYDPPTGQVVNGGASTGMGLQQQVYGAGGNTPTSTGGAAPWSPGQGQITAAQVVSQYGADPAAAQYWADKI